MHDMAVAVFEFGGIGVLGVFSLKRLRDTACKPEHALGGQIVSVIKG